MRRTLIHYWRMNLAVVAGAAVASAVLTGALLVGDSVRGSLRQLTLERLGAIDQALSGQRFFRSQLAAELAGGPDPERPAFGERFSGVAPAILLQGSAQHAGTRARASRVAVQGVGEEFLAFFDDGGSVASAFGGAEGSIFPPAVINEPLRAALDAAVGDDVLISLKRWSEVPRGSLLGRKDTSSVVETVRLRVAAVIPDRGVGRFALAVHQASPYNVFVPLAALQKALGQEGTVNGLVVAQTSPGDGTGHAEILAGLLGSSLRPEDLGLLVEEKDGFLSVESQEFILKPALAGAVEDLAGEVGADTLPVLTYLVNRLAFGDREVPYSTVSALDLPAAPAFGEMRLEDGTPARLGAGEILLNAWTAAELGAAAGDTVELTFFVVGPREDLREVTTRLRVSGVVPVAGLAADATLSQEYPGIAGSDRMADWDPPFPIDLSRIRPADEAYWELYRGTPKAFVALATGRDLWRNRWGELTAIRAAPAGAAPAGSGGEVLAELGERFRRGLVDKLPAQAFGLVFQPVKELGLGASGGATDFSGMFIGFSLFLIASAAMVVALLFSLGVERRASEVGLLRAVGYPAATVRRRLLAEGGVLAAVGSLAGLAGAVAYASLMMRGLRTWWLPAVGTSRLELHVKPSTLALGFLISLVVVLFAIWLRVWRLRRVSTPALLNRVAEVADTRAGSRARWTAAIALGIAAVLIVAAVVTGETANPAIFGSAGPALLVGLLALFAWRLGGAGGQTLTGPWARWRMAASSAGRHRGRSLLSATLVAAASFLVVTVAAYQTDFSHLDFGRDSGTGGYALVGESDIPLAYDPGDRDGRFELGVGGEDEALLSAAEIVPLRLLPGDDTSCLNLYQPRQPRLVGVPSSFRRRGGFTFQKTVGEADNPWTLLEADLGGAGLPGSGLPGSGPPVIPAFGDANSMQWILKLKLGEELVMADEAGGELRLRLVGLLGTATDPSIFQSELLISEENFLRHFPGRSGWSYFLVEADPAAPPAVDIARALESSLEDYGFDAQSAAEKLESFHAVQNTYLSTFRTLGGLGLLLGTVGLAIVLWRNTLERRGELAALRAFGFRRSTLTAMVVVENGLLLLVGLAVGTVAALLTAAPNLLSEASSFPARPLAWTLGGIFLFGLAACTLAAFGALRVPLLPALKAER